MPVPLARTMAMVPTVLRLPETTGANVMFCQPYNVVTRWRGVSVGLYSCNRAALRVLSAY